MWILGINAYHGDSSACLIRDGTVVAAAEEERFRRIKHWAGFPTEAIRYCLAEGGITLRDLDHVAVSRNPIARLHRKALSALRRRAALTLIRSRAANALRIRDLRGTLCRAFGVETADLRAPVHFVEHHRAHLASTFFVSPFPDAAVLSVDGFGDFASTMLAEGSGAQLRVLDAVEFPHSLGLLYTAVTQYLGFLRYGDEYKVMGLAAYGRPRYADELGRVVRVQPGGTFTLDLRYFRHHSNGVDMTWDSVEPVIGTVYSDRFAEVFGPARQPGAELTPHHADLAASLQAVLEEVYFSILQALHRRTQRSVLCLAGGVAYNSVANGKIFDRTPFREVYIQAAAGDAGTAMGAAYYVWHQILGAPRTFVMNHAYWGPQFADGALEDTLRTYGLNAQPLETDRLVQRTAEAIAAGRVVGWFQGRMEWGPRALGNRSIVADPRRADMKDILNARIKRREPFRPFAPSILMDAVPQYFEQTYPDPFMIKVYSVKPEKRSIIPAVTHVDGTGRLQTVTYQENPRYWELIKAFQAATGVPVVLNTSFNENEPIVCTPREAVECYLRTKMDVLVLGEHFLERT